MRDQASQDPSTLSRRALIGAAGSPLAPGGGRTGQADGVIALCDRWAAKGAEIERLQARWSRLETWLAKHHGWYGLTEAEQRRLEAAEDLFAIDARLDVLSDERAALLAMLPALAATNLRGVAAKVAVAARLLYPADQPEAHRVLVSSLRDLSALSGSRR